MKKHIKLWLPVVLIISFVFIYFIFIADGKVESLTIYTYGDDSDRSEEINVNFKKGEIAGGTPLMKPEQYELNEYFDYVNDVVPKIKRKSYMSGQSYDKSRDYNATRILWKIDVVYSSGKEATLHGDQYFPKQWDELIKLTNELIGKDILYKGTYGYPLK